MFTKSKQFLKETMMVNIEQKIKILSIGFNTFFFFVVVSFHSQMRSMAMFPKKMETKVRLFDNFYFFFCPRTRIKSICF